MAQDRQDRSLLESLELDREATLLELAQAERHCDEAQPFTSGLETSSIASPPAYTTIVLNVEREDSRLMNSARDEIQSIRSSLSSAGDADQEALHAKIIRHSKCISSMLENDKQRLSQRWSLTLQDRSDVSSQNVPWILSEAGSTKTKPHQGARKMPTPVQGKDTSATVMPRWTNEADEISTFDPRMISQYISFLSWIVQLNAHFRQRVLFVLDHDIRHLQPHKTSFTGTSRYLRLQSGFVSTLRTTDIYIRF